MGRDSKRINFKGNLNVTRNSFFVVAKIHWHGAIYLGMEYVARSTHIVTSKVLDRIVSLGCGCCIEAINDSRVVEAIKPRTVEK